MTAHAPPNKLNYLEEKINSLTDALGQLQSSVNVVLANNLHQNPHPHNNLFAGVVDSNCKGQNMSRYELVNKANASVKNDPTNAELHRENKCFKSSAVPRSNMSIVQTNDNCLSHKNVAMGD